mgnify:CR=1 FL=1
MDNYQEFIAISRYARWLEEENRRETWDELVTRNMNMHLKKFPELEAEHGFNPNNGIQDLYDVLETLDEDKRKEVEAVIAEVYANRPDMAMVNSDKGITNLHVPNNVIII